MSLNPPPRERVDIAVFEDAADRIERKLGLDGQPRVMVFHEKEGGRHAHAVCGRIDTDEMKAVPLSHSKMKLREVSQALYLDYGWKTPEGLVDRRLRDPTTFTLEEWRQAKRAQVDARDLKRDVQKCYAANDGGAAFAAALEERGLWLARGDRRGHVALQHSGEAFALSRLLDQTAREVTAKLGPAEAWPGLQERRADIAAAMGPAFERMMADARADPVRRTAPLDAERPRLTEHHRGERERLDLIHADRMQSEDAERSARLKRGLFGVWRWVTGQRGKIIAGNTDEKAAAEARDRAERQALLDRRIEPRQALQNEIARSRERLAEELKALRRDRRDIEAGANRTRDPQQGRTDRGPREIEPS